MTCELKCSSKFENIHQLAWSFYRSEADNNLSQISLIEETHSENFTWVCEIQTLSGSLSEPKGDGWVALSRNHCLLPHSAVLHSWSCIWVPQLLHFFVLLHHSIEPMLRLFVPTASSKTLSIWHVCLNDHYLIRAADCSDGCWQILGVLRALRSSPHQVLIRTKSCWVKRQQL